ncbi:hypothetical protein ACTOI6_19080 (plasmid) [Komagataeibacter intermedius]|uniref:hypothetical protein n=1 Tax=Komagataeibacter intermedius TaxID=66229 RepID=UPI0040357067
MRIEYHEGEIIKKSILQLGVGEWFYVGRDYEDRNLVKFEYEVNGRWIFLVLVHRHTYQVHQIRVAVGIPALDIDLLTMALPPLFKKVQVTDILYMTPGFRPRLGVKPAFCMARDDTGWYAGSYALNARRHKWSHIRIPQGIPVAKTKDGIWYLREDDIMTAPPGTTFEYVDIENGTKITDWKWNIDGPFYAENSALKYIEPDCILKEGISIN